MKIIKYNKQGSTTATASEQAVASSPMASDSVTALSNIIKVQYDEHGNATLVIDGALCTTGDVTQNYEVDEPEQA